jgi:hypothetical protein
MARPSIGNAPNPKADPEAKDEFKDLDSDFKDAVAQESAEDIYKRISELSKEQEDLAQAKKDDQDLANILEKKRTAEAPYKEANKALKGKVKFCLRVLGDKGKL